MSEPKDGDRISMEQSSESIAKAQEVGTPKISSYDDISLSQDEVDSLFISEEQPQASEEVTEEPQPQETPTEEQPEQVAESTEEPKSNTDQQDDGGIKNVKIGDAEFTPDQVLAGLEALKNKDAWQKSNTEKSQSLANERKSIDKVNELLKDKDTLTELQETLGEDHPVLKALTEVPEKVEQKTEEPTETISQDQDKIAKLEDRIFEMESKALVDKEVADLVTKHPELQQNGDALNDVFKTAVDKGLNLEDAYVFANATMSKESALKQAISQVRELEAQKSQPEVTEPKSSNRDEREPQATSYDDIEIMLQSNKFYDLVK